MVYAEFSEEHYRLFLNQELVYENQIFIPTQPAESSLGIDALMNSQNSRFWNMWSQLMHGTIVTENLWGSINPNHHGFNIEFRANLFVQHKRPELITRKTGNEFTNWNQPYYRYKLDSRQQFVLSRLEANLSDNDALVVYACPACSTLSELQNFAISNRVIESSNFVKASNLENHTRYTFISGGTSGLAFSEPSEIKSLNLREELNKFRTKKHEDNLQFIKSVAQKISKTIEESSESFQYNYRLILKSLLEKNVNNEKYDKNKDLYEIYVFLFVSNIKWRILYEIRSR